MATAKNTEKPTQKRKTADTKTKSPSKKTAGRSTRKKAKRKQTASEPLIMRPFIKYLIAGCITILFTISFYFLCIRPYSYRWRPCFGKKGYGVCMPCCFDVHGIDISHYQGDIDWEKLKANNDVKYPIEFVFVKATEGGDHKDTTFTRNFKAASKAGLVRGAYHFFTPKTDPIKQAEFFIENVRLKAGDLPPVLDVEVKGKNEDEEIRQRVKAWLQHVERHYGVKPILYTSYKFKERYLNDSVLNTYPYWIAHYYIDSVRYKGKWKFWQHTDIGIVPGIGEDVDLDVFNGTLDELKALTIK